MRFEDLGLVRIYDVSFNFFNIILDPKISEWACKKVVGITCPIDQRGWRKMVLFLNEYS